MKNKQNLVISAVIVVALIAAWQLGKTPTTSTRQNNQSDKNIEQTNSASEKSDPKENNNKKTWTGSLKASDNLSKGVYILNVEGKNIYIKTSRDYSSLLDKQVMVTYEGTLESFKLGDITAK
ncbi:MAG: hypothetical protein JNN11_01380 [Candidatus Doudnabacteria bacterium]|nr:hypothetical protein [Candidatus Doudnabacteria bacterium]